MTLPDGTLADYLERRTQSSTVLTEMVRTPDESQGLLHTPREIFQQPFLWRQTAHLMRQHAEPLHAFLERAGLYASAERPQIVLTGAGTSDYVGLSLSDLLRRHFAAATSNWPTTRIAASPDIFMHDGQALLMVHFARSGNSPESRAVLELGLEREGVYHLVITCNAEGELAQLARQHAERVYLVVLAEAANDRGLAMTSSFTAMVTAGQALAHLEAMDDYVGLVERIAGAGEYLLDTYAEAIYELASRGMGRAFYLGNRDLYGAAVESALKVQELTVGKLIAVGEDTLAFRHGPISAVEAGTLVGFYLSADAFTRRYELDVLRQYEGAFARLGAQPVVVGGELALPEGSDEVLAIDYDPEGRWQVPALYQVVVSVLVGQLFGLFASVHRGFNVDDPSVEKALYSRTVQGVQIYEYTNGAQ